jgi:hypothetical protein
MSFFKSFYAVMLLIISLPTISYADDSTGLSKKRWQSHPIRETTQIKPMRARDSMTMRKMLRELKPVTITEASNKWSTGVPLKPKYEITDCTGSDGVDKVCCSWMAGDGGSSCHVFIALCNSHDGWSGSGNGNGAVCAGEGTVLD